MNSPEFSLNKTRKYSIKCFENFYINENDIGPIIDIQLGNKDDNIYNNFIKINENKYIYYSKESVIGKLYKFFDYKNNAQNYIHFDIIIRNEYNKLYNPIYDFKFYIKFSDIFCFLLVNLSLFYTCLEYEDYSECDFIKIYNKLIQFIIILIQFIRFTKFIEVKTYLFDNKDIYDVDNEDYFPNKVFNIDSFPLALYIILLILFFLHLRFPNKKYCIKNLNNNSETYNCDYVNEKITILFVILIPLYITFFTLAIFDILNDEKIIENYDKLFYNWNMNPIQSINKIDQINNKGKNIFSWKNELFEIKRLNKIDYINSYLNKEGKICGKDSYGNNLYFSYYMGCPINKIYVSNKNENLPGYQKINLNDGNYLYYTNEAIEEKIIIDIKNSSKTKIPLSPQYSDDLTNIPFYEEIDYDGNNSYLFSVNYLGINTSLINGEKLENFEHKMNVYESCSKGKLASFCLLNIFIFFSVLLYIIHCNCVKLEGKVQDYLILIIAGCSSAIYFLYIIFTLICLGIHDQYITNFMNKINLDFEREKNDVKWNVTIFIYQIILLIIPVLIEVLGKHGKCDRKKNSESQTNEINNIQNISLDKKKN